MRSTGIVFIYPKARVYDNSNGMYEIFLLLTLATQFELKKFENFSTTFKCVYLQKYGLWKNLFLRPNFLKT